VGAIVLSERREMMNDYLEYSGSLIGLSIEEEAWLAGFLEHLWGDPNTGGYNFGTDHFGGRYFYVYSGRGMEPVMDPALVLDIVHRFLRRWRPDDTWTLTWAHASSKTQPGGESTGGAGVASANNVQLMNLTDWAYDRRRVLTEPLSMERMRSLYRTWGEVMGTVSVHICNLVTRNPVEVLHLLSLKLTGTLSLIDIEYSLVGCNPKREYFTGGEDEDVILLRVTGDPRLIEGVTDADL